MSFISKIMGREILDSRGNPTVEVEVILKNGKIGIASVPSGSSTGRHEAFELRDNDLKRYFGKGILKAIEHINHKISPVLHGQNVLNQLEIDSILIQLDGKSDKSNLGANALLGVSLACCRAGASYLDLPLYRYIGGIGAKILPIPMVNILNGGVHANNNIDLQEFMIMPVGSNSFSEGIRWVAEVFYSLKNILRNKGYSIAVGDEGGFAPCFKSNEEAVEILLLAIEQSGRRAGEDIYLAIDAASSEFYNSETKQYIFNKSNQKKFSSEEMVNFYENWCLKYPIISIEDAMAEDDWEGWKLLANKLKDKIQLVGDDLFATNTKRLKMGIEKEVCNSILIKPNQIGTLSETIDAIEMAKKASYSAVISHRSGETEDNIIADISVAFNTGQIKTGSVSRSDRIAKYNQLLRIENDLSGNALYKKDNKLLSFVN